MAQKRTATFLIARISKTPKINLHNFCQLQISIFIYLVTSLFIYLLIFQLFLFQSLPKQYKSIGAFKCVSKQSVLTFCATPYSYHYLHIYDTHIPL